MEKTASRFLPDSELSRMNQAVGRIIFPSALLFELITESLHYYEETNHLFSPFLQQTMLDIGYDRSFEQLGTTGNSEAEIYERYKQKKKGMASRPLTLDPVMKSVILSHIGSLDFGGIAKGWSAQKMKNWLMEDGITSGLLDAGGDRTLWGNPSPQENWVIGLLIPFNPKKI